MPAPVKQVKAPIRQVKSTSSSFTADNLLFTVVYLMFGIFFFILFIAGVTGWLLGAIGGTFLVFFILSPLLLGIRTLYLDELGEVSTSALPKYSWILGFIGFLIYLISIIVSMFVGIGTSYTGMFTAAGIIMVLFAISFIIALLIPALGEIIYRKEIGLSTVGLISAVFAIIFPIMFLIFSILTAAVAVAAAGITLYITCFVALIWGILETISIYV